MAEGAQFLIIALAGENYAIPIEKLLEITVPRNIQKDPGLGDLFEGKLEYRGTSISVLNTRKILALSGQPGTTLLVVRTVAGPLGLLVDAVTEIATVQQQPVPLPPGVVNPGLKCYSGVLRYKGGLALLLNEDGLLP